MEKTSEKDNKFLGFRICVVTNLSAPSCFCLCSFCFWGEVSYSIGRNSLLGNRKQIAKFLMRTFTCRSTFLYCMVRTSRKSANCILLPSRYKNQPCQMAVVTATFQKCGDFFLKLYVRGKLVAVKVAVSHAVRHPSNSRKASNSRDVGNSKDPSSNSHASFKGTVSRDRF
jgi:hypothetical protein